MTSIRKRCCAALVLALGAAASAHAQPAAPGYYRVSGVSENDVLNVRAAPGTGNPRVGTLAPGASPIEVVEVRTVQGTPWGLIAAGEGAGWASMRYLERIELEGLAGSAVPRQARCGGTEPFWGLTFDGGAAVFNDPEEPVGTRLPIEAVTAASGRFAPVLVSFAGDRGYALFDRAVCSDGMSDIPYGWSLHLILSAEPRDSQPLFLSGCCRVRMEPPDAP